MSAASGVSSALEIRVFRESLDRYFLTAPNALYRGEAMYEGLTGRARCMLAALLSLSDGYGTSRAKIEKFLGECGRDAVDKALAELRTGGFLKQTRFNGGRGKFLWRWEVRMFPEGMTVAAAIEQLERGAAVSPGQSMPGSPGDGEPAEDVSAGQSTPGISGHGENGANQASPISAGQSTPGPPGHGGPGHGGPGPGQPDAIEETSFKKKQPPLTDSDPLPASAPAATETGGGILDPEPEPDPPGLQAAVEAIGRIRIGWSAAAIRQALLDAKAAGRAPGHAIDALTALAQDHLGERYGHTASPKRLTAADGRWWLDTAPAGKPTPAPVGPPCKRHAVRVPAGQQCRLCEAERGDPPIAVEVARRQSAPIAVEVERQLAALDGRAAAAHVAATAAVTARGSKRLNALPPAGVRGEERPGLAALVAAVGELIPADKDHALTC